MRTFAVILPDEVRDYQRFHWFTDWDESLRFFVRLVGIKITLQGIRGVYQPALSVKWKAKHCFIEFHISRWTSLVIKINKQGIQTKWFDIRKEYGSF